MGEEERVDNSSGHAANCFGENGPPSGKLEQNQ